MHEFFIDDAGELKRLSRYDLEDAKLADNLVQNTGFISVRLKTSSIELRLRLEVVTVEALIGLMYWLADTRPTRVILTVWDDNAWRPAIASSREWRAERICELIKTAEENVTASKLHEYLSVRGPTAAIECPPLLLDQRQSGRLPSAYVAKIHDESWLFPPATSLIGTEPTCNLHAMPEQRLPRGLSHRHLPTQQRSFFDLKHFFRRLARLKMSPTRPTFKWRPNLLKASPFRISCIAASAFLVLTFAVLRKAVYAEEISDLRACAVRTGESRPSASCIQAVSAWATARQCSLVSNSLVEGQWSLVGFISCAGRKVAFAIDIRGIIGSEN